MKKWKRENQKLQRAQPPLAKESGGPEPGRDGAKAAGSGLQQMLRSQLARRSSQQVLQQREGKAAGVVSLLLLVLLLPSAAAVMVVGSVSRVHKLRSSSSSSDPSSSSSAGSSSRSEVMKILRMLLKRRKSHPRSSGAGKVGAGGVCGWVGGCRDGGGAGEICYPVGVRK
jgi:hypothetical protein